jgi:hypothetical protein
MKRVLPSDGLSGPQHYWKMMVALSAKGGFTIADVHKLTNGCALRTVKAYVLFCARQQHALVVGQRPTIKNRAATIYKVRDHRLPAPIQRRASFEDSRGRGRQQLWTAIRALKLFTVRELAVAATTSEVPVSEKLARGYVGVLAKAGYLAEVGQRTRSGQQACWKLMPAFNTGPLSPATIEGGAVLYDRNLGRSVNLNSPEIVGRAA